METGINVEFGQLTVDHVTPHAYKSGVNQAQVRQIITKKYPSVRVGNNLQDTLVGKEEFNLPSQNFDETRVTWLDVPTTWTVTEVQEALAKQPNALIYKYISSQPIFTDGDLNWIDKLSTEDDDLAKEFINERRARQLVKTAEGEIILDKNGNEQFARNFFAKVMPQNCNQFGVIDERAKAPQNYEMKEEIPRVQLHNAEQVKETVHSY
jgi:hypothetical protein